MKDFTTEPKVDLHGLSTGVLTLRTDQSSSNELFRLAERQNPKRAFLFVSTVLGRHIPVHPAKHRRALVQLSELAAPYLNSGPVLVMGYAETAVGLGAGVFDCLNTHHPDPDRDYEYLHTTRHPSSDDCVWFSITEDHSHATDHHVMTPVGDHRRWGADATLVLVDDETTTGKTFAQLAGALHRKGVDFGRIVLVTLTDWSGGDAIDVVSEASGCDDVRSVSLMSGSWDWSADTSASLPSLPVPGAAGCPEWKPDPEELLQAPRHGLHGGDQQDSFIDGLDLQDLTLDGRILVVGSGEHVWQPFLYAERLAMKGCDVSFIATTRSPILPGPVIKHKITFPDHFGLGLDMYLHNVCPDDWDDIVFFTETGIEGVHQKLREELGKGYIVDCTGAVYAMNND